MTPTSPLAGLFTGLVDGLLITVVVFLAVALNNRRTRHRSADVVHPVGEDLPVARPGELPKPFTARH